MHRFRTLLGKNEDINLDAALETKNCAEYTKEDMFAQNSQNGAKKGSKKLSK